MPRLRIGLRARLLLLGLVAALPALALALDVGWQLRRLAADAAMDSALYSLRQIAQAHERALATTRSLLTLVAAMPEVRGAGEDCRRVLARLQQEMPRYANLGLIGADGRLRCSVLGAEPGLDLSGRRYFQEALRSRDFTVGRYQVGHITDRPSLNMALPVLEEGEVEAVVFAALDLAWLHGLIDQTGLPEGSRVSLLDADGRLLSRLPDGTAEAGKRPPEAAAVRRLLEGRDQATARRLAGPDGGRVFAATRVAGPGGDLLLYAAIPPSTAFAAANRLLLRNLLGGLAVVVLVLGGAWLFSEVFILRRVQELLTLTGRLSRGELQARSKLPDDGSELGKLGRAFDEMALNLQDRNVAMQQQQRQINRLNRVYAVLSGINGVIIRAADQHELLAQACRIASEHGRFPLAWIALREDDEERIGPIWQAGEDLSGAGALLPRPRSRIAELGPFRAVLEHGELLLDDDIREGSAWSVAARSAARRRGYGAVIALPLRTGDTVAGCLCLYAREADFFSQEEVRLLKELAADVSLALANIRQSERLAYLARNDPLTGLANLKLFRERLEQALHMLDCSADTRQLAVLVVAVDGLDEIANLHGHHVADALLRETGRRIARHAGAPEQIGRIAHAQLAALIPGILHPEVAAARAQAIIEEFGSPVSVEERDLYVSVRIGIALAPDDGKEAGQLLQHAGSALSSLRRRPDRYRFFTPQMHRQARRRLEIEHALRHALERDELYLVYQPLVDIRSRRAVGVEVLLRWRHPIWGELSPAQFIPVAESSGMIGPIGDWVLRSACLQAKAWAAQGLRELKVAVNVSVSQLRQPQFLPRLEEILQETGADPRELALGLEVTESELMEEAEHVIDLLRSLRERGYSLSIDDFGTGYSSLAYLRQLPVDTLKIDASFVRDLEVHSVSASIIDAIIALARHLGLSTVAEGVETAQQLQQLRELGCDTVQGNVFSPPLSAAEVPERLAQPLAPQGGETHPASTPST